METIIISIYLLCTLTAFPVISIGTNQGRIEKVKNLYHSYRNGYGFDTRLGYPY
tara:strand:+ start:637 stop:798 length:162 start_codon:yes stop_codon:yes gene_type:complete